MSLKSYLGKSIVSLTVDSIKLLDMKNYDTVATLEATFTARDAIFKVKTKKALIGFTLAAKNDQGQFIKF